MQSEELAMPVGIVFLIDVMEHSGGGTEGQLLRVLGNLDRDRFEPRLVCLRSSPWLESQTFDFPVTVLGVSRVRSFDSLRGLGKFAALLRRYRVRVVHAFFPDSNVFGCVATVLSPGTAFFVGRRDLGHWQTASYVAWLRLLRLCTIGYIANSEAVARHAIRTEQLDPRRVHVIYNGLDPEFVKDYRKQFRAKQRASWKIKSEETLIGSVANLHAVKNHELLIQAAALLRDEFPSARYVVVGTGDERDRLTRRITRAGLADCFRLVGRYADVRSCLAAFDIGVLTSHAEGFSNAICEYMAAGLPVVASDVGGAAEALEDGVSGLLFPTGDIAALVQKLRCLLADAPSARSIGQEARKRAQARFQLDVCMRAHEDLYWATLRGAAVRPTRPAH